MSQPWGKPGPHFVSLKFLQSSFWPETSSSETSGLVRLQKFFARLGEAGPWEPFLSPRFRWA
jgi:hypothetical protein